MTRKTSPSLEDSLGIPRAPGVPGPWPRVGDASLEPGIARRKVVRGSGDMTGCDEIRAMSLKCARAIGTGSGLLVIDLTTVERADTKLMACLVSVFQLARSSSVSLELRSNRIVRELAEFCRLTWLIEQTQSPEAA